MVLAVMLNPLMGVLEDGVALIPYKQKSHGECCYPVIRETPCVPHPHPSVPLKARV